MLDVNLGENVFPFADALAARGVPFLFATGYSAPDMPQAWRDFPRLEKPIEIAAIACALPGRRALTPRLRH